MCKIVAMTDMALAEVSARLNARFSETEAALEDAFEAQRWVERIVGELRREKFGPGSAADLRSGRGRGVIFTLENLNPRDHPGCPFGATADVLALIAAADRPHLRINLDLYHTQISEGGLIRWCEACLPWIGEIQVADQARPLRAGNRRDRI